MPIELDVEPNDNALSMGFDNEEIKSMSPKEINKDVGILNEDSQCNLQSKGSIINSGEQSRDEMEFLADKNRAHGIGGGLGLSTRSRQTTNTMYTAFTHRNTYAHILDDQNYGLSRSQRRKYIRKNFIFSLVELMVVVLAIEIVYLYADKDFDVLNRQDVKGFEIFWIAVYGLLYLAFFLRRLVLICMWLCMRDPRLKQAKINCLTFTFLNSFEFLWFIYGNTFFYTHIYTSENKNNLWKIMLAMIIYGYISMFVYVLSLFGIMSVFCIMWSQGYFDTKYHHTYHKQLSEKNNRDAILLDSTYMEKFDARINVTSGTITEDNSFVNKSQATSRLLFRSGASGATGSDSLARPSGDKTFLNSLAHNSTNSQEEAFLVRDSGLKPRRTTKLTTGRILLQEHEIVVFEQLSSDELSEAIEHGQECALCLMPFQVVDDPEQSRLRPVRSQIEYVNQLADSHLEFDEDPSNYLLYHLQCFNQNFTQVEVTKYTDYYFRNIGL